MKTLALADGDLVVGLSRRAQFVAGKDKLIQDLKLWLAEPLGWGPTTPNFGSLLDSYVGNADPQTAAVRIEAEVRRVLGLYQTFQFQRLRQAKERGTLSYWNRSGILAGIKDVTSEVLYDRVIIVVTIQTMSNNEADQTVKLEVTV